MSEQLVELREVRRVPERDARMLKPDEAVFIAAYLETSDATIAKERAGLAPGSNVARRPHVRARIEELYAGMFDEHAITVERVVQELGRVAFANIDDFVDDNFRVIQKRPERHVMAAVSEITVDTIHTKTKGVTVDEEGNVIADEGAPVLKVKIKMHSKMDALDKLGRHFKMFTDKIEVSGDLSERLMRAKERLGGSHSG